MREGFRIGPPARGFPLEKEGCRAEVYGAAREQAAADPMKTRPSLPAQAFTILESLIVLGVLFILVMILVALGLHHFGPPDSVGGSAAPGAEAASSSAVAPQP